MASRVLLLTEGLDGQDGGVQRVSRSVLAAARSDRIPTVVWSSNDVKGSDPAILGKTVEIRCFGRRYLAMGAAARLASDLPGDCRKLFCWHLALAPVAMILARRLKCPFDVFLHGIEAWRPLSFWQRKSLRHAHAFSANSGYTVKRFFQTHPELAAKPSLVIPLGVSPSLATAAPSEARDGEAPMTPYFLTVTRFAETYKGEETLLRGFKEVCASHANVRLVCVGEGPRRQYWENFSRAMGLADRVQFRGHVSDTELAALYTGCLAFALLSEEEGFGLVYVEAMFHGKACLAADAGAVPELVAHEKNGLLVPARDVGATAAAMRRLLEDPGLNQQLGDEGRRRAGARYTAEAFEMRLRNYLAIS